MQILHCLDTHKKKDFQQQLATIKIYRKYILFIDYNFHKKKKSKLIFGPRRSSHTHKDRCWISVYALKTSRKNFLITVQTPAEYFDHEKECHQIHKQGSTTLKQFACLKERKRCAPIKRKNICASHSNNNNKRGGKEGGERKESIASPEKKHNNLMIQRVN